MSFDIDPTYAIYGFAALSAILFGEGVYLLFFSAASYRNRINRRLSLLNETVDRQSILVELRRERGLTSGGDFRLPVVSLNRLIVQSGISMGLSRIGILAGIAAVITLAGLIVLRGSIVEGLLGALFSGLFLPYFTLRMLRGGRQKKFGAQFPDAIDIIVRSLRAGHPVPVAISMVARELADPVGTEFGIVADEITYGADLETAMRNLSYRVGQEDLPLFVTAVAIQGATGGNLSEILENLSRVIRERFKMRRKVKALASEGKFSALFLSALPIAIFFMIRYVAPDFYGSVWKYDITKMGLAMAATWMAAGNLVMYRMVNFRI
jgi:tight adherence protein B